MFLCLNFGGYVLTSRELNVLVELLMNFEGTLMDINLMEIKINIMKVKSSRITDGC